MEIPAINYLRYWRTFHVGKVRNEIIAETVCTGEKEFDPRAIGQTR